MDNQKSNLRETLNTWDTWVEFEDTHTNFTADDYKQITHGK